MRCYAAHRDRLLVLDGVHPDERRDASASEQSEEAAPPRVTVDERRVALRDHRLECVAAHPAAPDRAFVGTFESGLLVTRDGGASFERAGANGSPSTHEAGGPSTHDAGEPTADDAVGRSDAAGGIEQDAVTAVAVDPTDPETVWVGTEPSRLYRSTDAGRSFERVEGLTDVPSAEEWSFPPRPDTHHVRWVEPDPNEIGRCYIGIEAGALVYTTDGGETWHDRPPGSRRDNHQLATHADAPGRVYAAAGDGYAASTDGGETWETPQAGLEHRYVWSVLPDPADPDRVLVTAARGPGSAHSPPGESYLYRRDGRDAEWERLDGPLSGSGRLRAVLAGDESGRAWAVNDRGCYVSSDVGDTWARLDVEWPGALEGQTARGLAVVPESGA